MLQLDSPRQNTWCVGCGNFGILTAVRGAIRELIESNEVKPENIVLSSGIGCHAKIVDYLKVNSFYSIHGRVPPTLTGMKVSNPGLKVIGFTGDGDGLAEGVSHLIHAAKRNTDITMVLHDNQRFSLTTGQFTPTTPRGQATKTTPEGSIEEPLNPLILMLASGATFVARGFTGEVKRLKEILKEAVRHKGFSFVDVLQPCVTFNDTWAFYRERVYDLEDGRNLGDLEGAMKRAREWGDRIPTGIFYRVEKPTFEDALLQGRVPSSERGTPNLRVVLQTHI
ncbi:MAG: thiamine pyrophosphate-dependent enzyme [Candidatus Bathyarchaeia archaeon]